MRFQFKEPRRCLTGTSHFTFPAQRTHQKLLVWKCYGTEAPLVIINDPVLTYEEEQAFFRQHGLLYVEHGNDVKLELQEELKFTAKVTNDYSDLI